MKPRNLTVKMHVKVRKWFKLLVKVISLLYNIRAINPNRCAQIIHQASQKTWCVYRINKGEWRKLDVTIGVTHA